MLHQHHSYRNVFKATSLFGGVQFINILISIVRSKVIALFVGPSGFGVFGLLQTSLNLVTGITNLGLDKSAVKELSFIARDEDPKTINRTAGVIRKLVWVTGIAGALLMALCSPLLSILAFGDQEYTFGFIWLSLALLFNQISAGELALLQGLRKLNYLARANILGNLVALLITAPLYYFYRIDAIVPALIITSVIALGITFYYGNRLVIEKVQLSIKEAFQQGSSMIRLGITLSIGSMIALAANYLIQIFISASGGVGAVGFYTAGNMVLNAYVGLIFNAMATDYFPRLSAVADSISAVKKTVLEQAFIAILLITPILIAMIFLAPWVINLLYAREFQPVSPFLIWGLGGMLLKAASWAVGYVIIAKGDSKLYLRTALFFSTLMVGVNILGYYLGGLEGLGISMCIYFGLHFIGVSIITFITYRFYFKPEFYVIFGFCILLTGSSILLTYFEENVMIQLMKWVVFIISLIFAVYFLNKKMDIIGYFKNFLNRKKE